MSCCPPKSCCPPSVPIVPPVSSDAPPLISRYTFRSHLTMRILFSGFAGIFGLREVVARNTLQASEWEIVFLVAATHGFFVFGYFFSRIMQGRPKAPFLFYAGLFGRGALLLMALATSSPIFVLLCCISFLAEPIILPAWNSILQGNYDSAWRGRLTGRVVFFSSFSLIAAALATGAILDLNPYYYRWLFPLAAGLGILSCWVASRVRVRRTIHRSEPLPISFKTFWGTFRNLRQMLCDNPVFDKFEQNFFIYGLAFMLVLPINVFLLVDHLHMSYFQISLATLVVSTSMMGLAAPLAGKLFDHFKAVRASAIAFLLLAIYPVLLGGAYVFSSVWLVYAAFACFGIAMACVNCAWVLGPMHFAEGKDSAVFMGAHMTSVGIRAIIAPVIGYIIADYTSLLVVYILAAGLLLLSSGLMFRLARCTETERHLAPDSSM